MCHIQCDMVCSSVPPCERCHNLCDLNGPPHMCDNIWDMAECESTDGCTFNQMWWSCQRSEITDDDRQLEACHCGCDTHECADQQNLRSTGCDSCHSGCDSSSTCGSDTGSLRPIVACRVMYGEYPSVVSSDIDPKTGRTYDEVCRRCHTACGQPHTDGQSTRDQKLACGEYCLRFVPGDKQCTAACEAYDDNLLDAVIQQYLAFTG